MAPASKSSKDFTVNVLFASVRTVAKGVPALLHPKTKPSEYRIGRRTDGSLIWIGGVMRDTDCDIVLSISAYPSP